MVRIWHLADIPNSAANIRDTSPRIGGSFSGRCEYPFRCALAPIGELAAFKHCTGCVTCALRWIKLAQLTKQRGTANVRYWHKADIPSCTAHVRFWGKADMAIALQNVAFDPKRALGSVTSDPFQRAPLSL